MEEFNVEGGSQSRPDDDSDKETLSPLVEDQQAEAHDATSGGEQGEDGGGTYQRTEQPHQRQTQGHKQREAAHLAPLGMLEGRQCRPWWGRRGWGVTGPPSPQVQRRAPPYALRREQSSGRWYLHRF